MAQGQEELSLDPGFIDDVGKRLDDEGTSDVNELINKLQLRYQHIRNAETQVLQQRQRHQQKLQYLKQTLGCVDMLLERRNASEDTIVDYSLAGAHPRGTWRRDRSAVAAHLFSARCLKQVAEMQAAKTRNDDSRIHADRCESIAMFPL